MIKQYFLMFFLITGVIIPVTAQQESMYSQYVFNGLLINPAYAGSNEVLSTTLLYRNQWGNIPGAPKTGIFSLDAPLRNQKVGLGMNVSFDKIGVTNHTGVSGIYSYKVKFSESALMFGVQVGIGFSNSSFTSVKYSEDAQADVAFQTNFHETLPNFGAGVYYYTKKFFIGLSIPQIAGKTIERAIQNNAESAHLDLANHYFLSAGYLINATSDIRIKPSVLFKYVNGAPIEMDLNGVVWFYDFLGLGISYRSLASLNFMGQLRITNQLYVGYAYEYSTSFQNKFNSGSHEIMLQYLFDFSHARIVTPRFF